MAGIPIVEVVSGGVPAVDTPNGAPVTVSTSGGLAVTWVTSGGIPLNKGGGFLGRPIVTGPPSYVQTVPAYVAGAQNG